MILYYTNQKYLQKFDPSRFVVEDRKQLDPFAFIPFAAGKRLPKYFVLFQKNVDVRKSNIFNRERFVIYVQVIINIVETVLDRFLECSNLKQLQLVSSEGKTNDDVQLKTFKLFFLNRADAQIKIFYFIIICRYNFIAAENFTPIKKMTITMKSSNGIHLKVSERETEA